MGKINENISRNIKQYMDVLNIKQIDLAKMLNCSNTTVSMWIKENSTPRTDKIDELCDIFGCERQDLIRDVPKDPDQIRHDQIIALFKKEFKELDSAKQLQVIAYMKRLKREDEQV